MHKISYALRRLSRTFGTGNVSVDEIRGVKDQSIGMLAIAFAILISTIIGATNVRSGQIITSFHVALILDLSWMNNTSTWIWFLLYAHHLTKPGEETEPKREPIVASWLAWSGVLISPVRRLVMDGGKTGTSGDHGRGGKMTPRIRATPSTCLELCISETHSHPGLPPPVTDGCHRSMAVEQSIQVRDPQPL
ncbi:hypothetical protein B0H14DRAFT_703411 [Mycena olivaceomarginata]|nr:hypothetical protein B0H14DRAFT_703411 [Mycena olivaceomarginata]